MAMTAVRRRARLVLILTIVIAASGCSLPGWAGITRELLLEPPRATATPIPTPTPAPAVVSPTEAPSASVADPEEALLTALYERVRPAVVSVQVVRPIEGLLIPRGEGQEEGDGIFQRGQGSGMIIDPDGTVVTNIHVVEGAQRVEVTLWDGTILPAEVIGRDPDSDIAVLRIERGDIALQTVELGDSDALRVGQRALAIGNPFGWQGTLTVGIVSGLGRTLQLGHMSERVSGRFSIPEMIQTDAAINFGNSGGPLLDAQGRVIGVNTAMNSTSGVSGGVGFAVPINTVKRVLPDLIATGTYRYPWLGITGTDLRPVHREAMALDVPRGAIIDAVTPNGPADRAGLRGSTETVEQFGERIGIGGDVIVAIDDRPVRQFDDLLIHLVRAKRPGDTVQLTVVRDGAEQEVTVTLGERPSN
jgi:S1-C subfamily serine protease